MAVIAQPITPTDARLAPLGDLGVPAKIVGVSTPATSSTTLNDLSTELGFIAIFTGVIAFYACLRMLVGLVRVFSDGLNLANDGVASLLSAVHRRRAAGTFRRDVAR